MTAALPTVPPRTEEHIYKGVRITLRYTPSSGDWEWSLIYVIKQPVGGTAKSASGALFKARTWVDKHVSTR